MTATLPTPPAAPVTTTGPCAGEALPFQRHDAQHGGVAGGADGHGLARGECVGQFDQPFALDPRPAGQAAPQRSPTPQPFSTTRVPGGRSAQDEVSTTPAKSMPGTMGLPHDRAATGDGQRVLVIQRRPFDAHRDVAIGQAGVIDRADMDRLCAVGGFSIIAASNIV
jgi:hypothetical protein